jgi:hypothetical protein
MKQGPHPVGCQGPEVSRKWKWGRPPLRTTPTLHHAYPNHRHPEDPTFRHSIHPAHRDPK